MISSQVGRRALAAYRTVDRRRASDTSFCVVSDDCWAGRLYQHLDRPYNSPFVGVTIRPPHYLRLLSDLSSYMDLPLTFRGEREEGYPIGWLGDVQIKFVHYPTEEEAAEKWNRRTERMDFDNLFLKLNAGSWDCSDELRETFFALPYDEKLALSRAALPGCVEVPNWCEDAALLFHRSQEVFDAVGWVTGGSTRPAGLRARVFTAVGGSSRIGPTTE